MTTANISINDIRNGSMTLDQLEAIGNEMFEEKKGRWGSEMANAINKSAASVSNIRKGANITGKFRDSVLDAYELWCEMNGCIPFSNVAKSDGRFAMVRPVVRDEENQGKFVAASDIGLAQFAEAKAAAEISHETDEEILARLVDDFEVIGDVVTSVVAGDTDSGIIYGPPGIGKSEGTNRKIATSDRRTKTIKGKVSGPALFQALCNLKDGGLLLLDDVNVFEDEATLDILKSATDSGETRIVSWENISSWSYEVEDPNGMDIVTIPEPYQVREA